MYTAQNKYMFTRLFDDVFRCFKLIVDYKNVDDLKTCPNPYPMVGETSFCDYYE